MKRIFHYYSYEQRREVSEKECRETLGEVKFNDMMAEVIEVIDRKNGLECDFLESMFSDKKSPYIDWCVEEYTGRCKHSGALAVLTVFVCAAIAIIKWLYGPVRWIASLFNWVGFALVILGSGLMLKALVRENAWECDLGYPLLFAGSIIATVAIYFM